MLPILILYISSVRHYVAEKVPIIHNCTLPSHPKNGVYIVTKPENNPSYLGPGDTLPSYTLELFCDLGFAILGHNYQSCSEDGQITGNSYFKCLPYCAAENDGVLYCGESPRCVMPGPATISPRHNFKAGDPLQEDTECGVVSSRSLRSARSSNYAPYVAEGRSARRDELPWHAGIYTKNKRPYMQICGGSLVSHTVVISAAHCFWNETKKLLPASHYAVAVGKLYRPWNELQDFNVQKSDVAEIKIPQYFQGHETNLQDDIALVIVATPFSFNGGVRPVCLDFNLELDQKQLAPGKLGKVAGWGLTSADGVASPVLKVVEMPVVDISECFQHSDPVFRSYITSDKICAGYMNGTAVCKGDSGGGLSFPEEQSGRLRYYLRGIVSGSPQSEHLCNTLAWASFTHLLAHEHFIRETVY